MLRQPKSNGLPKESTDTVKIHIHSVRKRLADPDGLSGKAVIDGLVKTGVLPDDSLKYVSGVEFSQEKGSEEKTIITIEAAE